MFSKIKLAALAASLISTIALAAPAVAATHSRHAHATISPNVRAQTLERRSYSPRAPYYPEAVPAPALNDYPHVFCCS